MAHDATYHLYSGLFNDKGFMSCHGCNEIAIDYLIKNYIAVYYRNNFRIYCKCYTNNNFNNYNGQVGATLRYLVFFLYITSFRLNLNRI